MIRKLLSVSMLAAFALGANAYGVDEFVYTKTAKYQILGDNIVQNGKFNQGATGTDGWLATDASAAPLSQVFAMKTGGPNGSNTQEVLSGQTALTAGMYQLVPIEAGGTYVVTLRVMGAAAGFSDLDLTAGNTNYINAYYNTDGALATVDGTNLLYGEGGVCGGYGFSFSTDGFTEVSFAVEAPADGFIVVDFRGLNEGLEIGDVECHLAQSVADERVAERRLAYIQKFLDAYNLTDKELFSDVQETMDGLKEVIANAEATAEDMDVALENLNSAWAEFTAASFSNIIDIIPPITGSVSSGNTYSANWGNWTGKYNKLNENFPKDRAPWTWNTDRWHSKSTSAGAPMGIQWQRGAAFEWDNIATLTTTLSAGKYYWGCSGDGGMMTLNKNRWIRSWAKECANTEFFFNGDTTEVFVLDPAVRNDYVYAFELTEEKEITLGIRCNTSLAVADGFDVNFYDPVLFKVIEDGQRTPEQEAYLKRVQTQMEAFKGRLDLANQYLADDQVLMPWGKEELNAGVELAQARYDEWAALSEDDILAYMENYQDFDKTVMEDGVRYINNNFITPFVKKNSPLTDMPVAIEAAKTTQAERIYGSSTKMLELTEKISEAQAMYEAKLLVPFSVEDSLALVNEKKELDDLVAEFMVAVVKTSLVDIDFGTQNAPVSFVTVEDPNQEIETYYTITGAKGTMKFSDITGGTCYALGYNNTDSLGILRVGNSEAIVEFANPDMKASDIINIQFDMYYGNLIKRNCGFYVRSADDENICGLYCSKYSGTADYNSFDIDFNGKISAEGSNKASNAAIAAESNRTHFNIVLDYGAKVMYCTTSGSKGTVTTESKPLDAIYPAKFVIASNYDNADRRSWFDNLVIDNIPAEPTAVQSVEAVAPETANNAIYNIAGQQISTPAKGQIYIKNGAKFVK